MEIFKYCVLSLIVICFIVILIFASRTKKALSVLLFNSILGLAVFFGLYFTKKYTGITLAVNQFTIIGSALFGMPAVCGFLLLNLLF